MRRQHQGTMLVGIADCGPTLYHHSQRAVSRLIECLRPFSTVWPNMDSQKSQGIRTTLVGCVVFSVLTLQQTRYTDPRLVQCWPAVYDAGPTLNQPRVNVYGLLGHLICDSTGTRSVHLSTCSPSYQKAVSDAVCKVTHTTLIKKITECSCPVFTFIQGDTQCKSYRRTQTSALCLYKVGSASQTMDQPSSLLSTAALLSETVYRMSSVNSRKR